MPIKSGRNWYDSGVWYFERIYTAVVFPRSALVCPAKYVDTAIVRLQTKTTPSIGDNVMCVESFEVLQENFLGYINDDLIDDFRQNGVRVCTWRNNAYKFPIATNRRAAMSHEGRYKEWLAHGPATVPLISLNLEYMSEPLKEIKYPINLAEYLAGSDPIWGIRGLKMEPCKI